MIFFTAFPLVQDWCGDIGGILFTRAEALSIGIRLVTYPEEKQIIKWMNDVIQVN